MITRVIICFAIPGTKSKEVINSITRIFAHKQDNLEKEGAADGKEGHHNNEGPPRIDYQLKRIRGKTITEEMLQSFKEDALAKFTSSGRQSKDREQVGLVKKSIEHFRVNIFWFFLKASKILYSPFWSFEFFWICLHLHLDVGEKN